MLAAVYVIEAPSAPWLWPLLALAGIFCQLTAAYLRMLPPLFAGTALVWAGCLAESDLTLLAGDSIAAIALYAHMAQRP